MGLSSCKAAINQAAVAIIKDVRGRMRNFHRSFTDTRGFEGLSRDVREGFYGRQMDIEKKLTRQLTEHCHDMDTLAHDMGVAIDAEAD